MSFIINNSYVEYFDTAVTQITNKKCNHFSSKEYVPNFTFIVNGSAELNYFETFRHYFNGKFYGIVFKLFDSNKSQYIFEIFDYLTRYADIPKNLDFAMVTTNFVSICITDCKIDRTFLPLLIDVLKQNPNVLCLELDETMIGYDVDCEVFNGFMLLADYISTSTIANICIANSGINVDDAKYFLYENKNNTNLRSLHLGVKTCETWKLDIFVTEFEKENNTCELKITYE